MPTVPPDKFVVLMVTTAATAASVTVTVIILSWLVPVAAVGWTVMVDVPAVMPVMVITPLALIVAVTLELFGVTVTLLLVVPSERFTTAVTESAAPPTVTADVDLERVREETVTEAEAGVVTVKVLVMEFAPEVIVNVLSPAVAVAKTVNVAVIWVPALLTLALEIVTPDPAGKPKLTPTKLVPTILTTVAVPVRPVAGVMEVTEATAAAAALTFKVNVLVTVWPLETTVITKLFAPAEVGVPEIIKVDGLKVKPAGRPVTVQVALEARLLASTRWP